MYQYFIYNIWDNYVFCFASILFCQVFSFWVFFFYFLIFIPPEITLIYHQCSLCLRPPVLPSFDYSKPGNIVTSLHHVFYKPRSHWELSIFGGNFTTNNRKKNKQKKGITKKKSFINGEWGLSRWKCTWRVFVSVSAVSLSLVRSRWSWTLYMCVITGLFCLSCGYAGPSHHEWSGHWTLSEVRECPELPFAWWLYLLVSV